MPGKLGKEVFSDCWDMLKEERAKTLTLEEILKKYGLLRVE